MREDKNPLTSPPPRLPVNLSSLLILRRGDQERMGPRASDLRGLEAEPREAVARERPEPVGHVAVEAE